MANKRVLSIQSHVVSGYVGNKSAVFPLQLLGFDVDVVNSVHFSNHTGYPNGFKGDILKGNQLKDILSGLEANDLLHDIGYLLTGYIGSESFLEAVLDVLTTLRKHCETIRYVCDPVLGDKGRFYIPDPEKLIQVYKIKVLPMADVLTPNQFELEQLAGMKVESVDDAIKACRILHKLGPELVVVTSMELTCDQQQQVTYQGALSPTIAVLASSRIKNATNGEIATNVWRIDSPMLPGQFTGTGDLFASLLLAHSALEPNNIPCVMERVMNTMFAVIERTHQSAGDTVKSRELKLIQSKSVIENPPLRFQAKRII